MTTIKCAATWLKAFTHHHTQKQKEEEASEDDRCPAQCRMIHFPSCHPCLVYVTCSYDPSKLQRMGYQGKEKQRKKEADSTGGPISLQQNPTSPPQTANSFTPPLVGGEASTATGSCEPEASKSCCLRLARCAFVFLGRRQWSAPFLFPEPKGPPQVNLYRLKSGCVQRR